MFRKSKEELRRIQELRRSNASQPIKSKKLYNRKEKYNNEKGERNNDEKTDDNV